MIFVVSTNILAAKDTSSSQPISYYISRRLLFTLLTTDAAEALHEKKERERERERELLYNQTKNRNKSVCVCVCVCV